MNLAWRLTSAVASLTERLAGDNMALTPTGQTDCVRCSDKHYRTFSQTVPDVGFAVD